MSNVFKTAKAIYSFLSYKGLPFPVVHKADELKTHSDLGATLRKKDASGRYYFMPVVLIHKGTEYEIPNAIIGYTAKKTIVETPMIGRQGTVKELININDYEINIAGAAIDSDWPEAQLKELNELFTINEAIELKCALTDLFMETDDKVVIKSMDFTEMKGTETLQTVRISLVTDRSFELIIE
jgi:hypothetical protein